MQSLRQFHQYSEWFPSAVILCSANVGEGIVNLTLGSALKSFRTFPHRMLSTYRLVKFTQPRYAKKLTDVLSLLYSQCVLHMLAIDICPSHANSIESSQVNTDTQLRYSEPIQLGCEIPEERISIVTEGGPDTLAN